MRILTTCYVLILLVVSITCPASAREWSILGPRALGMGGAHVAVANDSTASYWNPAAYGFFGREGDGDYSKRDWSSDLSVGVGLSVHEGLGEAIDEISEYDFDVLDEGRIEAENVGDYVQLLSALETFSENEDRAAKVSANAKFGVQVGHFGIGGTALAEISARGDIDTVNIIPETEVVEGNIIDTYLSDPTSFSTTYNGTADYFNTTTYDNLITTIAALEGWNATSAQNFVDAIDNGLAEAPEDVDIPADIATDIETVAQMASDAQTGNSFEENESELIFKGIFVFEVPLTYGRAITDDLAVGGNFKYMKARTYNVRIPVFDTEFEDALDDAMDDYEESSNFGIDLGVLYAFGNDLRLGMVVRNLNSPSFDMKNASSIEEEPQVRTGVCYKPLGFLMLAADYDLTKNDTTISGVYKSQNFALGAELNILKILNLRVGGYKNLAQGDMGWVYTAGLGLNLWLFNLDVGVAMAKEKETIDEEDYPKEVRAEFALSMLF